MNQIKRSTLSDIVTAELDRMRQAARLKDTPQPTIEEMKILDPRIGELIGRTRSYLERLPRGSNYHAIWYGVGPHFGIKFMVCCLAGRNREEGPENLKTCHAYNVLYDHLLAIVHAGCERVTTESHPQTSDDCTAGFDDANDLC